MKKAVVGCSRTTLLITHRETNVGSLERGISLLSRGGDVKLVLQDVVNHWLSQIVHYVAVSMLESQSTEQKVNIPKTLRQLNRFFCKWNQGHIDCIIKLIDIQGHIDCIIKTMPLHKRQKFVKAPLVSFQIFLWMPNMVNKNILWHLCSNQKMCHFPHLLLVELTTDIGWFMSSFTTVMLLCHEKKSREIFCSVCFSTAYQWQYIMLRK